MAEAVRHALADQERFSTNAFRYTREHLAIEKMVDRLIAANDHARTNRR